LCNPEGVLRSRSDNDTFELDASSALADGSAAIAAGTPTNQAKAAIAQNFVRELAVRRD
jgi:hypothetical protein